MSREHIFFYFFIGLIVFFLIVALLILSPFIKPILWAIIFSIILYPLYDFLTSRIKSKNLSALLVTGIVLVIIVLPFSVITVVASQQVIDLGKKTVTYFEQHNQRDILISLKNLPLIGGYITDDFINQISQYIQKQEIRESFLSGVNQITKVAGEKIRVMAMAVGMTAFKVLVFLLTLYFLLRDGPKFLHYLERAIPMEKEDLIDVTSIIYRTVLAVAYGAIGTAIIQSIIAFIGYSIVGIKYSLLWAIMTFVTAFIPPFGASMTWFPLVIYTFFDKGLVWAIFLFLWGMLLVSSIDNFVRPLIIKKGVEIPYIVLFFSTIGGLLKFGFIGLFLGPIIFTTLFTLFKIYERKILGNSNKQ